nr:hypothetical protein [Candidatus Electrothrix aestuarii]
MPKLMTCNSNIEMSIGMYTNPKTPNNFSVEGIYRKRKDFGALIWNCEDIFSHPKFKYSTKRDFRDVVLEFDFDIEGAMKHLFPKEEPRNDDYYQGQSMTITTTEGVDLFYNMYDFKTSPYSGSGVQGLEEHSNHFFRGSIRIDFNKLYNKDPRLAVGIESIKFGFAYKGTIPEEDFFLGESLWFRINYYNWNVSGKSSLPGTINAEDWPQHKVNICDDYDDMYNLTPERIIEQIAALGFNDSIDYYIGASHYYEKKVMNQDGDKAFEVDRSRPLNFVFESWFENYLIWAKKFGFREVIASISMENLDTPKDWAQRYHDGGVAQSGWQPPPTFITFTNPDVLEHYKNVLDDIVVLQKKAGLELSLQLGEPWWWHKQGTNGIPANPSPPAFYDKATKDKHLAKFGRPLPLFTESTANIDNLDSDSLESLQWLGDQIGGFTLDLVSHAKQKWGNDVKFGVLFFTPSVLDDRHVGKMMQIVNFPKKHWSYQNSLEYALDFFQVEDYDYLIQMAEFEDSDPEKFEWFKQQHDKMYDFTSTVLGYPNEKVHYFSGFVLSPEKQNIWKYIDQAAVDSLGNGLKTYVWAATQVFRDGWTPIQEMY